MQLCNFSVGADQPFFLIAGPCVVESEALVVDVAGQMKALTDELGIPYDKPEILCDNHNAVEWVKTRRVSDGTKHFATTFASGNSRCRCFETAVFLAEQGCCKPETGILSGFDTRLNTRDRAAISPKIAPACRSTVRYRLASGGTDSSDSGSLDSGDSNR